MSQGDREQSAHNDGQTDYAEGNGYNEPHGGFASFFGLNSEKDMAENEAYRDGWRHARSQDD